jgi:hypothetical protein
MKFLRTVKVLIPYLCTTCTGRGKGKGEGEGEGRERGF